MPNEEMPGSSAWPILAGLILTGALISGLLYIGISESANGSSGFEAFLLLDLNEKGDTLAGIFASLAFIWIVVTVFLQATELRAQRHVLMLQRAEFREISRTQSAQLELIQAQTGVQLLMASQERELRADAFIQQLFKAIEFEISRLPQHFLKWTYEARKGRERGKKFETQIDLDYVQKTNAETILRFSGECMRVYCDLSGMSLTELSAGCKIVRISAPKKFIKLEEIHGCAKKIIAEIDSCSPAVRAQIIGSDIGVLEKWLGVPSRMIT